MQNHSMMGHNGGPPLEDEPKAKENLFQKIFHGVLFIGSLCLAVVLMQHLIPDNPDLKSQLGFFMAGGAE